MSHALYLLLVPIRKGASPEEAFEDADAVLLTCRGEWTDGDGWPVPWFILRPDGEALPLEGVEPEGPHWFVDATPRAERWEAALRLAIRLSMTSMQFRGLVRDATDPEAGTAWPHQAWFDATTRVDLVEALFREGAREIAVLYERSAATGLDARSLAGVSFLRRRMATVWECLFDVRNFPRDRQYVGVFGRAASPKYARSMDLRPYRNDWWSNPDAFQDAIVFADIHT